MMVSSAVELVNSLVYKPGWKITATDHTSRFESCIAVRIEYPARQSEKSDAPEGYPNHITTYATFPVLVDDVDDVGLYRRILEMIMEIELHEAREFLRVLPTYWAPFHPHRADGMRRFGDPHGDLRFGIA